MNPPDPLLSEDVVRALVDPRTASHDPVVQLLQVAMSGFGYNFYDARNVARSNDALVRERAGGTLGEAAAALATLERRYRERAIPPASREAPYPPPEALRRLRAIDAAKKRCEALVATLAGAETPATDAIWFRIRDEQTTLLALVNYDVTLTSLADRVRSAATGLDPATFDDDSLQALEGELGALEHAFAQRRALLRG